jgi:hypothetical protein
MQANVHTHGCYCRVQLLNLRPLKLNAQAGRQIEAAAAAAGKGQHWTADAACLCCCHGDGDLSAHCLSECLTVCCWAGWPGMALHRGNVPVEYVCGLPVNHNGRYRGSQPDPNPWGKLPLHIGQVVGQAGRGVRACIGLTTAGRCSSCGCEPAGLVRAWTAGCGGAARAEV